MMHFDIKHKRILEVGCGLGLSSLVLNSRGADITATDIHPEARPNLRVNTRLNDGDPIPYFQADWRDKDITSGSFDLVIGSDILYQRDHPALLARFIQNHTSKDAQIIVVDPARGNMTRFGQELAKYGFNRFNEAIGVDVMLKHDFKGQMRTFQKDK